MRNRLAKHRAKITELEAQASTMEKEITAAEDEQLGYLARSVANTLSGGMEEIFEMLRGLRANAVKSAAAGADNSRASKTAKNKEVEAFASASETE